MSCRSDGEEAHAGYYLDTNPKRQRGRAERVTLINRNRYGARVALRPRWRFGLVQAERGQIAVTQSPNTRTSHFAAESASGPIINKTEAASGP